MNNKQQNKTGQGMTSSNGYSNKNPQTGCSNGTSNNSEGGYFNSTSTSKTTQKRNQNTTDCNH